VAGTDARGVGLVGAALLEPRSCQRLMSIGASVLL